MDRRNKEMNRKMVKYHDVTDKEEIRKEEARREYRENDEKEDGGAPRYSTASTADENLGMFMVPALGMLECWVSGTE
jgi:hypothetical protein